MEKEQFKAILESTTIDPKYYDKVMDYIETHVKMEIMQSESTVQTIKSKSTLPLALYVISKLNNLDNVVFMKSYTTDIDYKPIYVGTFEVRTVSEISIQNFNEEELQSVENGQINELSKLLNIHIVDKKVYIHILFNMVKILSNSTNTNVDYVSYHMYSVI
jgi:hypothetical protein